VTAIHRELETILRHWVTTRVARWFAFKQKIQIWVNFGGP
jgi:hypothetical protein